MNWFSFFVFAFSKMALGQTPPKSNYVPHYEKLYTGTEAENICSAMASLFAQQQKSGNDFGTDDDTVSEGSGKTHFEGMSEEVTVLYSSSYPEKICAETTTGEKVVQITEMPGAQK